MTGIDSCLSRTWEQGLTDDGWGTQVQTPKFSMKWAEEPLDQRHFGYWVFTWASAKAGKWLMWYWANQTAFGNQWSCKYLETVRMLPVLGVFNTFAFFFFLFISLCASWETAADWIWVRCTPVQLFLYSCVYGVKSAQNSNFWARIY